jgi:hypothetical protein
MGEIINDRAVVQRLSGYEWHCNRRIVDTAPNYEATRRPCALHLRLAMTEINPPPYENMSIQGLSNNTWLLCISPRLVLSNAVISPYMLE